MPLPTVSQIESGGSILFVGAGLSMAATNLSGINIKSASDLAYELLDQCGIADKRDYDLDTAAEVFTKKFDQNALERLLHDNFHSLSVTSEQKIVINQPWRRIYTTNYDDVIERSLLEVGKAYTFKELSDPVEPPIKDVTQIMHIYGSIKRLSAKAFMDHFILTEKQRDNSPFLKSSWFRRFSDDVLTADSVVFVGFSLRDIDIRRLLGLVPNAARKTFFIESPTASQPAQIRLARHGHVELIGIEGLALHLGRARPGNSTVSRVSIPVGVEELHYTPAVSARISGFEIQNLLAAGVFNPNKLSQADATGSP